MVFVCAVFVVLFVCFVLLFVSAEGDVVCVGVAFLSPDKSILRTYEQ